MSRLRKNPGESTQTVDIIVWEHCDESEDGNGIDRRLPWRNRGESSDCTRILQYVWFFRVPLNLEQKHEMVTAISVEVFPGVLQTEQKHIGKWREAIEAEINIRHSEIYRRPSGARYLVGSTLVPMCKSRYPVHFVAVDVKSTRTIVDQAFSVPKCVRLARMSERSYELLCEMFSAVPERILGKKFMGYVSGNFSDFERQKQRGSTVTDYNTVDENDEVHRVMMEVEPLLEASGKCNWRCIMLTHDEFPCHCSLQTW